MEKDMSTMPVMNKTGNEKGLKAITVVASIAAICGIGFGIYGMMQSSQKNDQISDLKIQVKSEDGTITTVETDKIETKDGTVTISDVSKVDNSGPYIEDGYFYVPKWGAKFKLSNDLVNYGYAVDQSNQGDSYGNYVVGLTAISKNDYVEHPQSAYYNDIFSCSVVTIRAMEESKKDWWGGASADVQFDGLDFVIHDTWRTQNCTSEYMAPTEAVAKQLKTILSNPEKI